MSISPGATLSCTLVHAHHALKHFYSAQDGWTAQFLTSDRNAILEMYTSIDQVTQYINTSCGYFTVINSFTDFSVTSCSFVELILCQKVTAIASIFQLAFYFFHFLLDL